MKARSITVLVIFLLSMKSIYGQAPNSAINKEEMKKLSAWVGQWKGEGSMQMGPGEPKKSSVDERIEMKLDGTILIVEGIGKTVDPTTKQEMVVHNAFGVLSFDAQTRSYKFKTYLKDGRSSDAYFTIVGDNKYEWGFDIPGGNGKTKYSIALDPVKKTWNEIGEFSRDGATWMKFFEMNLVKI